GSDARPVARDEDPHAGLQELRVPVHLARRRVRRRVGASARPVRPLPLVRSDRHDRDAPRRLPGRVLDRLQGRTPQDHLSVPDAVAVLRVVRDPVARVDVHPRGRRLREQRHPRRTQHHDDRQRDPTGVPERPELPAGLVAVVHPDGRTPDRDPDLCARARDPPDRGVHLMATIAAPERIEALEAPVRRTPKRSWKNLILPTYTKLVIAYLLVPIAVMILYSFNANTAANASAPKVSFRWQGFTFDWWRQWNGVPDLTSALWNS